MKKKETVFYSGVLGRIDNNLSQNSYTKERDINLNISDIFELIGDSRAFVFGVDENEYFISREYVEQKVGARNRYLLYKNGDIATAVECIEFLNLYFEIAEFKKIEM